MSVVIDAPFQAELLLFGYWLPPQIFGTNRKMKLFPQDGMILMIEFVTVNFEADEENESFSSKY